MVIKMRSQTVLPVAVAALALLGVTQAIKCYSCRYNSEDVSFDEDSPSDPRCGESFDSSMESLTGVDTTDWDYDWDQEIIYDPEELTLDLNAAQNQKPHNLTKLFKFKALKLTGVSAGPHPVYCAKATGPFPGYGNVIVRGFVAGSGLSATCVDKVDVGDWRYTLCLCRGDECNSASGLELSFGLIAAVVLIGKLVF